MVEKRRGRGNRQRPKSLTRGSFSEYIAELAIETGIAPNELIETSPEVLDLIYDGLVRRKKQRDAQARLRAR